VQAQDQTGLCKMQRVPKHLNTCCQAACAYPKARPMQLGDSDAVCSSSGLGCLGPQWVRIRGASGPRSQCNRQLNDHHIQMTSRCYYSGRPHQLGGRNPRSARSAWRRVPGGSASRNGWTPNGRWYLNIDLESQLL
jgi:hypothetical protein